MKRTKILIVDDLPIFSFGLSHILRSIFYQPKIFYSSSVQSAQALADEHIDLDFIFLDLNLPGTNGVALVHYCHSQKYLCPIIIVSATDDVNLISTCIKAGVSGIMSKNVNSLAIQACVNTVQNKSIYIQPNIQAIISSQCVDNSISLSARQKEILLLISEGYNNKEISKILGIAIGTVKKHVSLIIQIFNADNRTQCAAEARRQGVIF